MGKEEQADSLDEEEVAIAMEIAEVIERGKNDKLPALRNEPKKKLLEETNKFDKVLSKFKTHSITRLMICSMLKLLLLQIDQESRLIRQLGERNHCGR